MPNSSLSIITSSLGEQSLAKRVKPTMSAYRILKGRNDSLKMNTQQDADMENILFHILCDYFCIVCKKCKFYCTNTGIINILQSPQWWVKWVFFSYCCVVCRTLPYHAQAGRKLRRFLLLFTIETDMDFLYVQLAMREQPACFYQNSPISLFWSTMIIIAGGRVSDKNTLAILPLTSSESDRWLIERPVWFGAESQSRSP